MNLQTSLESYLDAILHTSLEPGFVPYQEPEFSDPIFYSIN